MRTRFAALGGAFVGVAVVLLAIGGCEAIVGDSPGGNVQCFDGPGVNPTTLCPAGQTCIGGVCKPGSCSGSDCGPHDGGFDAPRDVGVDHPTLPDVTTHDVGPDVTPHDAGAETSTLLPLGANCSMNSACQSGVCGTSTLLTSNVMTPEMGSVCTKPCCTSADCDDPTVQGFVCFPSVGGDYCVDPTWIGLPKVAGMGLPGAPCPEGASDCRSSVCTDGSCQDTCCLDSDCGGSSVCQDSTLDGMDSFNCGPSGGSVVQGGDCEESPCVSNLCVGDIFSGYCVGACCRDSDCNDLSGGGATSCNWLEIGDLDGGDSVLRGCSSAINPGEGKAGATCTSGDDCKSGLCYAKTVCTTPCCVDSDCTGGWTCSYASFSLSPLTLDLQVCVPPS
jgi:hypothetical protein